MKIIKKICLAIVLINLTIIIHAQSPLGNRGRDLDEQDGYAIVDGENYHYWLYNIYYCLKTEYGKGKSYHDILNNLIADLHRWVERQGWTIDYENAYDYINENISLSVQRLMQSRGRSTGKMFRDDCEVSVLLDIENSRKAELRIHNWNSMKAGFVCYTRVYPLLKF